MFEYTQNFCPKKKTNKLTTQVNRKDIINKHEIYNDHMMCLLQYEQAKRLQINIYNILMYCIYVSICIYIYLTNLYSVNSRNKLYRL